MKAKKGECLAQDHLPRMRFEPRSRLDTLTTDQFWALRHCLFGPYTLFSSLSMSSLPIPLLPMEGGKIEPGN